MLFTIGSSENYRGSFVKTLAAKGGKIFKSEGGYAVRSREEARQLIAERHADKRMAVFGLLADWEQDTIPSEDGWWHLLRRSMPIVMLDEGGQPTVDLDRAMWD